MAARFTEVLPNYGVDDTGVPIPEMIVPLRGTNHILLVDGAGLDVKAAIPGMVDITEVYDFVRGDLVKPRMFRLKGKALAGKVGLMVEARRGKAVVTRLRVYVLENRIVRLAVRPLQTTRGINHAKVLADPVAFVYQMNEIWTPQANVLIDLYPSNPAVIDTDAEDNAREMGAFQADGFTPDTTYTVMKDRIQMLNNPPLRSFGPVFLAFLQRDPVPNTDYTLFVVQAISAFSGHTSGVTDRSYKFALVDETSDSRVWAHELGHLLRAEPGESGVTGELMVSGGTGQKISVQDAVQVFNGLHTKAPARRK